MAAVYIKGVTVLSGFPCVIFFALLFNRRRKDKYSLQHKILKCLYHDIIFVSANVKADRKFAALKCLLLLS